MDQANRGEDRQADRGPSPAGALMTQDHLVHLAGEPGEILSSENELVIAAGNGALALGEVQLEGKRRMSASEFLRGHASLLRAVH